MLRQNFIFESWISFGLYINIRNKLQLHFYLFQIASYYLCGIKKLYIYNFWKMDKIKSYRKNNSLTLPSKVEHSITFLSCVKENLFLICLYLRRYKERNWTAWRPV